MHPMKRAFLIVLFSLGTVGGFAHGLAHVGRCASSCHAQRRQAFEDRVADVCTRAAQRVYDERASREVTRAATTATEGSTL
ncbi:MAG: hypothetical protein OHK0013_24990 [Sandaracinaceae bacterium]